MRPARMLLGICLLGACLVAAGTAAAQPPPAAAPPPGTELQARMDAARRLMAVTGAAALAGQMVDAVGQQLIAHLVQANPGREAEVRAIVAELLLPEFRARIGELEEPSIRIWSDAFTAAEMEEIMAFYATPVGRKALALMPELATRSTQLGMAWGQRVAQEAFIRHEAAMRARGVRF